MLAVVSTLNFSPGTILNLVLFAVLILLFAIRLDFGLALTVFVIPFWNLPKTLFGGFQLAPVEALTWIATAAYLLDMLLSRRMGESLKSLRDGILLRTRIPGLFFLRIGLGGPGISLCGILFRRVGGQFWCGKPRVPHHRVGPVSALYGLVRLAGLSLKQNVVF